MLPTLLLALGAAPPVADLTVSYVVAIADPAEELVDVTARLEGLDGPLRLSLPEGYSFVRLPEPRLDGPVEASAPDGTAVRLKREGPYRWRLDPRGAAVVDLAWRVPLDHRRLPAIAGRDEYESPYLEEHHGMLVTGALFLAPTRVEPAELRVRFELPEGWPVLAPWPRVEEAEGSAGTDGAALFAVPNPDALRNDLVAIGHWDVAREQVGGVDLTVAFAPGQDRLRDAVIERVGPIVKAELELFGSRPHERYLFLFGRPQPNGYGGSPKAGSMTLFVSSDLPVDFALAGIEHLIAHEYHHTWMRARCQPPDELRFVVEGFTDYYAWRVPWQLGFRGDAWLRDKLQEKLAEHEQAQGACGLSLAQAGGPVFFQGGDAHDATYAGGLVLALWLDVALRRVDDPSTLEVLLRDLYEDPRWRAGRQPALADLFALVERRAGAPTRARFEALVTSAGAPDLVAAFAAIGVVLERSEGQDGRPRHALPPGLLDEIF